MGINLNSTAFKLIQPFGLKPNGFFAYLDF